MRTANIAIKNSITVDIRCKARRFMVRIRQPLNNKETQ